MCVLHAPPLPLSLHATQSPIKVGFMLPCPHASAAASPAGAPGYPLLVQLAAALEEASSPEGEEEWGFEWIPLPAAMAVCHILHASLLRAASKLPAMAVSLGDAEEVVDAQLVQLGIDMHQVRGRGGVEVEMGVGVGAGMDDARDTLHAWKSGPVCAR